MSNRNQRRLASKHKEAQVVWNGIAYTIEDACRIAVEAQLAGNNETAMTLYRLIIAKQPNHVHSMNNLGYILYQNYDIDDAIALYRRVIKYQPEYVHAWNNLGNAFLSKGQIAEAEKAFMKVLSLAPTYSKALYSLTRIRNYTSENNDDAAHARALLESQDTQSEKQYLYFALAKISDDCGAYDKAFAYYEQANRFCSATASYEPVTEEQNYIHYSQNFTKEFLTQRFSFASNSARPLFIVGMPRSGTTLLANILSSHRDIGAASELPTFPEIVSTLVKTSPYPQSVLTQPPAVIRELTCNYEAELNARSSKSKRYVIDKQPTNFWNLGLIAMLFPNARIIHCMRHPLDTCLSNYFQYFDHSYGYSFDLRHISHFYVQYHKLMAHWRSVLPDRILEIHYEDAVTDTEKTARTMLDFLGLEWDERCLSPHKNPHPVRTASVWQVRQPVYTRSLERWRHYESYIEPLKEILRSEGILL